MTDSLLCSPLLFFLHRHTRWFPFFSKSALFHEKNLAPFFPNFFSQKSLHCFAESLRVLPSRSGLRLRPGWSTVSSLVKHSSAQKCWDNICFPIYPIFSKIIFSTFNLKTPPIFPISGDPFVAFWCINLTFIFTLTFSFDYDHGGSQDRNYQQNFHHVQKDHVSEARLWGYVCTCITTATWLGPS